MNQPYAIIKDNIIQTICVWNGDTSIWNPPEGTITVAVGDMSVSSGWIYDPATGQFTDSNPPAPPEETPAA